MVFSAQHLVRVAIVGAGRVGSTCAYALLLHNLVSEIVLISAHREHAEGEAMDLNHGMFFEHPARIWSGDYPDCSDADIVIIAAGAAQRPGESRMDLLKRNTAIFHEVVPQIIQYTREAILLVVTNPVDVLTYFTWKIAGIPPGQVIGTGTVLDTARLRFLLGQHFHIEPRSVHAYVIGEHGDTQVIPWSLANIAWTRLDAYGRLNGGGLDEPGRAAIANQTRTAAYEVIRRKGATYYAIAAGVSRIVEAITHDENRVLTVSSLVLGMYGLSNVSLSLPSIINRTGIAEVLELPLAPTEQDALQHSASTISAAIELIDEWSER